MRIVTRSFSLVTIRSQSTISLHSYILVQYIIIVFVCVEAPWRSRENVSGAWWVVKPRETGRHTMPKINLEAYFSISLPQSSPSFYPPPPLLFSFSSFLLFRDECVRVPFSLVASSSRPIRDRSWCWCPGSAPDVILSPPNQKIRARQKKIMLGFQSANVHRLMLWRDISPSTLVTVFDVFVQKSRPDRESSSALGNDN